MMAARRRLDHEAAKMTKAAKHEEREGVAPRGVGAGFSAVMAHLSLTTYLGCRDIRSAARNPPSLGLTAILGHVPGTSERVWHVITSRPLPWVIV